MIATLLGAYWPDLNGDIVAYLIDDYHWAFNGKSIWAIWTDRGSFYSYSGSGGAYDVAVFVPHYCSQIHGHAEAWYAIKEFNEKL